MDHFQRLKLKEMISQNDTANNTNEIRNLKHSYNIRKDVNKIEETKKKLKTQDFKELDDVLCTSCHFLFNHYTYIYNKLLKNDMNINILYKFLDVLEKIEENEIDQHEGSFEVGSLLKQIFIDKKIEETQEETQEDSFLKPDKNITFIDYMSLKN